MNPDSVVAVPDREALKRRYARINWNAHLVPVVREAVADFGKAGHPLPQVRQDRAAADGGDSSAAGDLLTIQFGAAPAPPGRPLPALVFAQAPSGAVAVLLYPAGTSAGTPRRIGEYRDPAELSRSRVRRLLRSLLDMPTKPGNVVEMPDREALKRRYARINWNAHLVPVLREVVADFGKAGHPLPQVRLDSEAIDWAAVGDDSSVPAEDSLTIQFGVDVPAPPSRPLPALVFAQAPSGAVAVLLFPAGTSAGQPRRIGDYRDPAELTRSRVRRLLRSLFDMHGNDSARPAAAA